MWNWKRFEELLERFAPTLLALLLIYAFARSVLAGTGKVYWYDELLTQIVAAQGSLSKIMTALRGPLDGQPPLFYVIESFASRLVANREVALRLPSAVATVCAMLCVYVFLEKLSGRLVALLSAAFLMMTVAFRVYASEARPYSLLVACIAFALVCYQRAVSWRWVVLLGASLALAESLYYLAVLSMVPFGLAELAESFRLRKIRWGVWAALAFGVLPLLLCWKLVALNKNYFGPNHVALGFGLAHVPHAYGDLLSTDAAVGMGIAMTAAAGMLISWRNPPGHSDQRDAEGPRNERIVIAGLLGLPFIAYLFALATHGPMTMRYFLPCVLGISMGFGSALARLPKQAVLVFVAFIVGAIGVTELHFWRYLAADRRELAEQGLATAKIIESAGCRQLPVVVPNGYVLWVQRYALPNSPRRLVYLTKDEDGPGDTTDKSMSIAQEYVPVQVQRASEFFAANSKFMIYTDGNASVDQWVALQARQAGWSVEVLAENGTRAVYLASKEKLWGGPP